MPTTRSQSADGKEVGINLTLDDMARKLTRTSGCLHSIANFINDTVDGRPRFFERFRRSGENSSANARALWRFHDRRWKEDDNNDDDEDEEDSGPIDEEVDAKIGSPFTLTRAVEVAMDYLGNAKNILRERKDEMEAWTDRDGAEIMEAFIIAYEGELAKWTEVKEHLARCSTYLGESFLDSSLRYGWL